MIKKSLEKTRKKFGKPQRIIELNFGKHSNCSYLRQEYESATIGYGICSNVKKEGTLLDGIKLMSPITTCRETLSSQVIRMVKCRPNYDISNLPKNRTCVLVTMNTGPKGVKGLAPSTSITSLNDKKYPYEEWMLKSCKAGCNLINHFEKQNKWLRTKFYEVEHNLKTGRYMMYCFIGPKWWLHSPQSFSLFNLLIRVGRYDKIQELKKNDSRQTIIKAINKLCKGRKTRSFDAVKIGHPTIWIRFIDNYKTIYKDRKTLESNWNSSICSYDGIQKLVLKNCGDKEIQKRFNTL